MIFLIRYDRLSGKATWKEYMDADTAEVQRDRLEAEMESAHKGTPLEIVVLRARTKDDLKQTHAKYFGDEALRENIRTLTQ